jgi:hypothetical protein
VDHPLAVRRAPESAVSLPASTAICEAQVDASGVEASGVTEPSRGGSTEPSVGTTEPSSVGVDESPTGLFASVPESEKSSPKSFFSALVAQATKPEVASVNEATTNERRLERRREITSQI